MPAGRPRKPTALKALEGTLRPDRMNRGEACPARTRRPPAPPARLEGRAAEIWRRLAAELHRLGVLTVLDHQTLADYCVLSAQIETAEKEAAATPVIDGAHGGKVRSPWVILLEHAIALRNRLGTELGLTPAARGRIDVKGAQAEANPYEKFLARRRSRLARLQQQS